MPRAGPCSRLPPGPRAGCPPGTPPPWSSSAASRSPPRPWRPRPAPAPIRTAAPGTAEYRRRASPVRPRPGRYRPRAVPGRLAVPLRAGVRQARPGGRLRGRLHADQPPPAARDPPSGRRAVLLLVHVLSPGGVRHKALQVGGALLSAATTPVLLRIPRRGRDPRTAAHRACCPAVPVEAVDDAHADVLGRPAARRRCPCGPVRAVHPALPPLRPGPPGRMRRRVGFRCYTRNKTYGGDGGGRHGPGRSGPPARVRRPPGPTAGP